MPFSEMKDRRGGIGSRRGPGIPNAYRLFLQEGLRSMGPTASLVPSSRHLASALLKPIDFLSARTIVELGPGTGPVTSQILRRLRPDAHVLALDINGAFIKHLHDTCHDPRLVAVCGSATDLRALLAEHGAGPVDAVVSSLGLTSMDPETRALIVGEIAACLVPGGIMTQYQYIHACAGHLDLGKRRFSRFNEASFLRKFFNTVGIGHVLRNFPPALVFTCRKAAA
ncbi:MAG: methyltransferase domain-containing protein [Terriglobia bacterium]